MLKIYRKHLYISINGEPWRELDADIICMRDNNQPLEDTLFTNLSFEQCYNYISNYYEDASMQADTTLLNKPCIDIIYTDCLESVRYKRFNTISCKIIYNEIRRYTLEQMIKDFPADLTMQYLKERLDND